MVMRKQPQCGPFQGLLVLYSSRSDIKPGISASANSDFLAAPVGQGNIFYFKRYVSHGFRRHISIFERYLFWRFFRGQNYGISFTLYASLQTITVNPATKVLIWRLKNPLKSFLKASNLQGIVGIAWTGWKAICTDRDLWVRHLLAEMGYDDFDLLWWKGKPHLKDGKRFHYPFLYFFGHHHKRCGGGDWYRNAAQQNPKIAHKFTPLRNTRTPANEDALIRKLTMVWGAKESLYKKFCRAWGEFPGHIYVEDFDMDVMATTASVSFQGRLEAFAIWFHEFEGYLCLCPNFLILMFSKPVLHSFTDALLKNQRLLAVLIDPKSLISQEPHHF